MESISISAGAIELAEMGIFLTANETTELPDMGLARKWIIFAELSMAPLCLNQGFFLSAKIHGNFRNFHSIHRVR